MKYRVKELREQARLTQAELALKSGVSRVTIAMMETKDDYVVTTRTLSRIAEALGITESMLFFAAPVQSAEQFGVF